MFSYIQKKYDFTDYQIAQLQFLYKSTRSEFSKLFVLAILFHNQFLEFCVVSVLLCTLRMFSGGIHCNTYLGCFITSLSFYILTLKVVLPVSLPETLQYVLILVCIYIGYLLCPITARCRRELDSKVIAYCRVCYITFLFLYLLALFIVPHFQYLHIGFWVILLHTLQLFLARIIKNHQKKGDSNHEE